MTAQKDKHIHIRLNQVLDEIAVTDSAELGMSKSEYIRHLILQARRIRLNKLIEEVKV